MGREGNPGSRAGAFRLQPPFPGCWLSAQWRTFPWWAKEDVPLSIEVLKLFSPVFAAPACLA